MGLTDTILSRANSDKVTAAWWNTLRTAILGLFGNEGLVQDSFSFSDANAAAANITNLVFTTATTSAKVIMEITRGSNFQIREFIVSYDGSSWGISTGSNWGPDTGLTISINAGQLQYVSTSTGNGGTIKFKTGWVFNA